MSKIKIFLEMIKFEHTIFALPFAYIGAFLAARYLHQSWPSVTQFIWITVAMAGARTAAMALNRLIDRRIDAQNPRTESRALPKGLLGSSEVILYTIVSLAVMAFAAYRLNLLCLELMPVAVFFLTIYSYTKRFTWACHFVLGITDALAPLGGWIAITGSFDYPGLLLALAVATWIGGFDIIYACQDLEFDRERGLHSIPVKFGLARGLNISVLVHVVTIILLALTGYVLGRGMFYFVGVAVAVFLIYKQHRLVSPDDLSRLNIAFLNMNGYLSVLVFGFTLLDLIWMIRIV